MSEVVNLNKARKARVKQEATRTAQHNRVIFGLPKAVVKTNRLNRSATEARHEGQRLEKESKSDAEP